MEFEASFQIRALIFGGTAALQRKGIKMQQMKRSALRAQEMQFTGFFPDEVMENILSKLPVKSLLRFKAVCKSWRYLFSRPNFVQMQIDYAKRDQNQMVLVYSSNRVTFVPKISIVRKRNGLFETSPAFTPIRFAPFKRDVIEDTCNGLVSFRLESSPESVYLWNPATRESKRVQLPYEDISPCVGLAFCAKTNDYKLVRVPDSSENYKASVLVYSLKSDSWKELKLGLEYGPLLSQPAITVQGCMHWISKESGRHIVAFDVENEVLKRIPWMADIDRFPNVTERVLGVMKGSLSLVISFSSARHYHSEHEVWQMGEYGVHTSWRKVAFIKRFDELPVPIGFYNDGILFRYIVENDLDVFFYNPRTQVKIYFRLSLAFNSQTVNYIETLASVECWRNTKPQLRPSRGTTSGEPSLAGSTSDVHESGNVSLASGKSDEEGKAEESDLEGVHSTNQIRGAEEERSKE